MIIGRNFLVKINGNRMTSKEQIDLPVEELADRLLERFPNTGG